MGRTDKLERSLGALLEKLTLDFSAADRRAAEVADVLRAASGTDPDRGGVAIVAVALDHCYSSIEASLEMIARVYDTPSPAGADWHRSLLRAMRGATETRPRVLAPETADGLEDLLAFRHFLRHAYAADLEWNRMRGLAVVLPELLGRVRRDMESFRDYVAGCLEKAGQGS